jgi:predicted AAA+ superfamily ATPase
MISNELIQYLSNSIVTPDRIKGVPNYDNISTMSDDLVFVQVRKYADDFFSEGKHPRMVAIAGLQSLMKSTEIWQLVKHILKHHTNKVIILNADVLSKMGCSLFDAFKTLENQILKQQFKTMPEWTAFLIDEVQEAQGWGKDLKIIYDNTKRSFIICTGTGDILTHRNKGLAARLTVLKDISTKQPKHIK